jgi:hypothetical protein
VDDQSEQLEALTAFLTARLDEDEAAATQVLDHQEDWGCHPA